MFSQFVCFCLIGGLGLVLDFAVTYLLKEKAKWQAYIANACGFILAATSNYILNRIWTFQSHSSAIAREYISFILIALVRPDFQHHHTLSFCRTHPHSLCSPKRKIPILCCQRHCHRPGYHLEFLYELFYHISIEFVIFVRQTWYHVNS